MRVPDTPRGSEEGKGLWRSRGRIPCARSESAVLQLSGETGQVQQPQQLYTSLTAATGSSVGSLALCVGHWLLQTEEART